ncbi:hypothetical protein AKO1_006552 [Acrasis kona]|uniref:F-box domain-containing protein n=1 Tax=Acrasis kona TaxID=1008807 RepID=A0AAW2ZM60_9EUKA
MLKLLGLTITDFPCRNGPYLLDCSEDQIIEIMMFMPRRSWLKLVYTCKQMHSYRHAARLHRFEKYVLQEFDAKTGRTVKVEQFGAFQNINYILMRAANVDGYVRCLYNVNNLSIETECISDGALVGKKGIRSLNVKFSKACYTFTDYSYMIVVSFPILWSQNTVWRI